MSIQIGFSLVNAAVACAILQSNSSLEPSSVITEPRYLKLVTVLSTSHGWHRLSLTLTDGKTSVDMLFMHKIVGGETVLAVTGDSSLKTFIVLTDGLIVRRGSYW